MIQLVEPIQEYLTQVHAETGHRYHSNDLLFDAIEEITNLTYELQEGTLR